MADRGGEASPRVDLEELLPDRGGAHPPAAGATQSR